MIRHLIKNVPFLYNAALAVKHKLWYKQTQTAVKKYLQEHHLHKLQLGAGQNELPGWFNTDYFVRPSIYFLDVTKKFPFADNTFTYVFSEHHIEHITYKQARYMLSETYRVMKPGGYIKITTPDLNQYIRAYAEGTLHNAIVKKHVKDWIYTGFAYAENYIPVDDEVYEAHFINDIFMNYEHRFIYDEKALAKLAKNAGFTIINKALIKEMDFDHIESHIADFDKLFTLYLYAQKPLNE